MIIFTFFSSSSLLNLTLFFFSLTFFTISCLDGFYEMLDTWPTSAEGKVLRFNIHIACTHTCNPQQFFGSAELCVLMHARTYIHDWWICRLSLKFLWSSYFFLGIWLTFLAGHIPARNSTHSLSLSLFTLLFVTLRMLKSYFVIVKQNVITCLFFTVE